MTDSPDSTREWDADKQEERIECLEDENAQLQRDHDLMLANLTATQARCTELLEEVRRLKAIAEPRASRSDYRDWDYQDLVDAETRR